MNKTIKTKAQIRAAVLVKDTVFFVVFKGARLYECNISSNEANLLGELTWEEPSGTRLYERLVYNDGKIYMIPFQAKYLTIYDLEKKEFTYIDINKSGLNDIYMAAVSHKNGVVIFGSKHIKCIYDNCGEYTVIDLDDWKPKIEPYIFDKTGSMFRNQCILENDLVYIPFCNANALLRLNLEDLKSSVIYLGKDKNGYSGITKARDGSYWLSPRYSGMNCVHFDDEWKTLETIPISHKKGIVGISGIIMEDNKPCLFVNQQDQFLGEVRFRECLLFENETGEMLFSVPDNILYIKDKNECIKFSKSIIIYEDINSFFEENSIIQEEDYLCLKDFFSII